MLSITLLISGKTLGGVRWSNLFKMSKVRKQKKDGVIKDGKGFFSMAKGKHRARAAPLWEKTV